MRAQFKVFKSSVKLWDTLFQEAANFASTVGEQRLINISHSCDNGKAVITVWFWGKESRRR